MNSLKVSQLNNQGVSSIQEAINILGDQGGIIYVESGIYYEKLVIPFSNITIIGSGLDQTILTYNDFAKKPFSSNEEYGTFRSQTLYIGGNDITLKNLTIQNTAGKGTKVGQAIGVYVDGDRIHFDTCKLEGNQDTLFLSPLPDAPIIPGSFEGAKKLDPNLIHRSYYSNCIIEGDIDFIFGGGIGFFESCKLISNNETNQNGFITAPSTPKGWSYGFVFYDCELRHKYNENPSVYLGRPWRNYGKATYIFCKMGKHIHPEGWHDWNKEASHTTLCFQEYHSSNEVNLSNRALFSTQIHAEDLFHYTRDCVLRGSDNWQP